MFRELGSPEDLIAVEQAREARNEVNRIAEEKGFKRIDKLILRLLAFLPAWNCSKRYTDAVRVGGHNIPCICGFHPSRREMRKMLTEETVMGELKSILHKFTSIGVGVNVDFAAAIILQLIDTLRQCVYQPELLEMLSDDPDNETGTFSKLASDVVNRFRHGEITAHQANSMLIELKGHYEYFFNKMRYAVSQGLPAESALKAI